jgi:Fic family protein
MRIPRTPPTPWHLATLAEPSRFDQLVAAGAAMIEDDGHYLHWDELLRRQPPYGLSHEQWWAGIKLNRLQPRTELPLRDCGGNPFNSMLTTATLKRLHEIDLSLGGAIEMPAAITTPEHRDRYYVSSLVEEAITSSQLEGATTTRKVAGDMLRAGRSPRDRSERMILNNFLTMRRIGELKHERLTPQLVFELHRIVTEGTLDDPSAAGRARRGGERVVVADDCGGVFHEPPPASELSARMDAMCRFANGETPKTFLHPTIRAIALHFWLAYDHPFVDGNGRTARALFYWCMLHNRYWLFEFISISNIILRGPSKYYRAFLHTETDDNDLTYFVEYHLQVIHRAMQALHAYIAKKTRELRELERELRKLEELNHRQRELLGHALRHPGTRYTVESHRASHAVVYETARTDLLDLVNRGLLESRKVGKKLTYTAPSDLSERLRT